MRASDAAARLDRAADHAAASMRPRRARLGCSHPISPWTPRQSGRVFDRWPGTMGKARQFLHDIISTMSKSFTIPTIYRDSSGCGISRGTSPLESAQRARKLFSQVPSLFRITDDVTGFCYMTVARRSIFENVLPMLSMANSILSAGPTSIRRTWSSPFFTSSRNRVSSSARRPRLLRRRVAAPGSPPHPPICARLRAGRALPAAPPAARANSGAGSSAGS